MAARPPAGQHAGRPALAGSCRATHHVASHCRAPTRTSRLPRVSQYLKVPKVPRLDSIRSRILALAVLGTLIPTGIALSVTYAQYRRTHHEKVGQELRSESSQTARAMGVWLKERIYDLRVFASSDEVSSNLARFAGASASPARARLGDYLRSLHERFTDFEQLLVVNTDGRVVASSAPQIGEVRLPSDWQISLRVEGQVVGDPYWDSQTDKGKLIVAVPVQRPDGRLLGAFAVELNLAPLQDLLRSYASDTARVMFLASESGALLVTTREISPRILGSKIPTPVMERLTRSETEAIAYTSFGGREVIGTLKRVPQVRWAVGSEIATADAFQQVWTFRNVALLVVIGLLIVVSAVAYRMGLLIVRPLQRLAVGAAEVAMGDLDVDLPESGGHEVAALTGVFNHMVSRLREGRHELERLSVTDSLTGLANHRSLMQRLGEEAARSGRNKRPFAFIMADVDHFKNYNDDFGHPAGDEVLKVLAVILRDCTRAVDCVARYGGEEFAILLPDSMADGAFEVAERIRARVEAERFPERQITISMGVAEFPIDADTPQAIVAVADEALYKAKRAGRNQVVRVRRASRKELLPTPRSSRAVKKKK